MTRAEAALLKRCGPHLDLLEACAWVFDVTLERIDGRTQQMPEMMARRAAVTVMRQHEVSLPAIGRVLDRDHTTVMCIERTALRERCDDVVFDAVLRRLETRFELLPGIRRDIPMWTLPKYSAIQRDVSRWALSECPGVVPA